MTSPRWMTAPLVAVLTIGAQIALPAQDNDAAESMRRVQRQDTAPGEQVDFTMQLISPDGQVRERIALLRPDRPARNQ